MDNINRAARSDGDATKTALIEAAGKLIAERGFANTMGKDICARAGTNTAAINYHFGGRDGLYIAVLEEVHRRMMGLNELQALEKKDAAPEEKLRLFLDAFVRAAWDEDDWTVRVWMRELLSPSPFIKKIITEQALPKLSVVRRIFSEYTGLSQEDERLYSAIVGTMAPFIWMMLAQRSELREVRGIVPVQCGKKEFAAHLKTFVLAGLKPFCPQTKKRSN